jgi:hypothetical protein
VGRVEDRRTDDPSHPSQAADPSAKARRSWWRALIHFAMPWISLALGVSSAVWMDRRPERAWLVALAAGAGWLVLGAFAILRGVDPTRLRGKRALVARAAHFSTLAASQSLVQLCLFFAIPFFGQASAVPVHFGFVGLLVAAGTATLWDPLYRAILHQRIAGAALQGLATFAGLDCVLPVLGLSNQDSLYIAALAAAAGLPLAALLTAPPGARLRHAAIAFSVGALLPVALALGAARFVPPAPLRYVEGAIGTQVVERRVIDPSSVLEVVPGQLVCATAIAAPRGLHDRLRHVWRRDGVRVGEVPLEVRGGRTQGFRTWSVKHNLAAGQWSCTVETETGQRLGQAEIRLGGG